MKISDTTYPFMQNDCIVFFGDEEGLSIFHETEKLFKEFQKEADYRSSEKIREHMQRKIFPLMAFYMALRKNNFSEEDALELSRNESTKVALEKKRENGSLAKMPCTYFLYRAGVKSHMKRNFPIEGWDTEWVRCDSREIHFDFSRCVYYDLTNKFGCPELCAVFCENDEIAFSGLLPKIRFERTGSLGTGADHCDFHFIKP